jgi:mRNA interferase RelE/StbE
VAITYHRDAARTLRGLPRNLRERIETAILGLPGGDVRPLQGQAGLWRLRVGGWRVIYRPSGADFHIVLIRPRGDVYHR